MATSGSITHWIEGLRAGQPAATQKIWEVFFASLVELARQRLRALPRRGRDEEDIALSAFDSFCRGAQQGRFPLLSDRDDLWQVLFVVTQRKAADLIEYESRAKRDWRKLVSMTTEDSERNRLEEFAGREPDPAFAAQVAEECQRLIAALSDEGLRSIAIYKMEGYRNEEIAARLGCSVVTVERRLRLIRQEWGEA